MKINLLSNFLKVTLLAFLFPIMSYGQTELVNNAFTGVSGCPTVANVPLTGTNFTMPVLSRSTITCNSTANVFNSTTLNNTAAVVSTSYIEFSIVANAGYVLNLKEVKFFRQASNSAPNKLEIRYSTDGFATSTTIVGTPNSPTSGTDLTNTFTNLTSTVGGTITFRLYVFGTQRADGAVGAAATTGTFRIDNLIINGTVNAAWNGSAWSNVTGPTSTIDALLTGAYSTSTNGAFSANNLNINTSGQLTVNSNTNVTLSGAVTNLLTADKLVVESNANLIQVNAATNTGNVTVNRNTAMQRLAYTYWSSPVAAQNLLAFSPLTLANRFSTYNEPTNAFVAVAVPSTTNFVNAAGYSIRAPNTFADAPFAATAFTGTYIGVPNNGTITIPATKVSQGYNLVGNPYPCTLSATGLNGFFASNTDIQTIYYWTKTALSAAASTNYATQSSLTGVAANAGGAQPNDIIQVGQGFIVLASATTTVTFNNAMKVGNNANQFFRNANTFEKHLIKLNLTTATDNFNQIAVGYATGATAGIDNQIDAATFNNGIENPTMISSIIDNSNYTIQAKGLPFANTDTIQLGFKTDTAGNYTISTASSEGIFANNQDFYLKDNLTGTTHNIKLTPYNFSSASGIFNSRFQLVYQAVLSTENPNFDANTIIVSTKDNTININAGLTSIKNVQLFDIRGSLVYEKNNVNATATSISDLNVSNGVMIVKITSNDGKIVSKKLVF